ncbi:tripartite motif-containing protein 45-like [Dendronephthya gigantea]|uniref:tripartite motif-containing protein 45-like n=1 Tax=Dendronephthya gigantea TaxID=151771 RepID=UPI00106D911E|nr:tripartite motif-containing protein 45-like [Dendronephthya gigantea]
MASASCPPLQDKKQNLKRLLECSICLETFDDPRTLSCLHSFCKKCLENFVNGKPRDELNCPVCRTKFTLNKDGVAGMTRNHFICNMVEMISIRHSDKCVPCSHCEESSVGRCITCEHFLCEKCVKAHSEYLGFRDHAVLTTEELSKPENRLKIKGKSCCKKHPRKKLKLYCETCDQLVCTYCVVFEHFQPKHVCSPLEDIAARKREELKAICTALESKKNSKNKYYEKLNLDSNGIELRLEREKDNARKRKDRILKSVEDALNKKVQTLIEEKQKVARVKKQAIEKEIKRVSDERAGQKKTYDMAKALVDNGSEEEIMLSFKLVQESVKNGVEKDKVGTIDIELPKHSNEELDNIFLGELKKIKKEEVPRQIMVRPKSKSPEPPRVTKIF